MDKVLSMLGLLVTHPLEFRTLVQFYLFHERKRDITSQREHPTSGWDRASMRRCWEFLDMAGRSYAAVIKELDGDLARTICIFYLVLRGLDTIEDDMTIPDEIKQPLLRSFHEKTVTPGWNFSGNGPNEEDRQLLVEYDVLVEEINLLKPEYKDVVLDICRKMEVGMADFAHKAATTGAVYLDAITDYDLYCHYVAGLVGEGLSAIWSASGKEVPWLKDELELSNSMGLLLQKTNIIRDYREDVDDGRFFWPREIWGQYGFKDLKELCDENNLERAMWAQSHMILDAMRHTIDTLNYLRMLKNQSVFVFCAIPSAMAMATLSLCFMNPEMLQRKIKIRKAEAAGFIMRSTNPRDVAYIFREYARKIHAKAAPSDPHFIKLSVACCRIEQWCETYYPSFVHFGEGNVQQSFNALDRRTSVVLHEQKRAEMLKAKRYAAKRANGRVTDTAPPPALTGELLMYVGGAFALVLALILGIIYTVFYFYGDTP